MARIKHRISQELAEAEEKKSKKTGDKKKHKKESRVRRSSRSRSRSRSVDGGHSTHSRKKRSRRSSSRSRSADRHPRDSHHHDNNEKHRGRSNSSDRPGSNIHSSRRDDRVENRATNQRSHDNHSERSDCGRAREKDEERRDREHKEGYGLVKRSDRVVGKSGQLGPDPELLKKKSAEDAEKSNWRKNMKENKASALSQEEKAARLAEMQRDASLNDTIRQSRIIETAKKLAAVDSNQAEATNPDFIKSMRSEVYNVDKNTDMEDRMKRNRYYMQQSSEFDKGFLKKS